jgi:hypothetical protein
MEFYGAMKKNEILPFASKGMELENIILSKVREEGRKEGRQNSFAWL